jgi:COP9 signalosome complex subunit 2
MSRIPTPFLPKYETYDINTDPAQTPAKKEDNPEEALKEFRAIVDQETEKGDWGFKALKQSTKLLFLTLHRPHDALKSYIQLLTYTKSAVTRNYSEKSINGILDYVGGGKVGGGGGGGGAGGEGGVDVDVLEKFYQATKDALIEAKNEVGIFVFVGCADLIYSGVNRGSR